MQAIAGWLCRGPAASDGERIFIRRLLCAVIVKAIEDAQRGDAGAAEWLESTGAAWCALLHIEPDDWQAAGGRLPAVRRELLLGEDPEHQRQQWRIRGARRRERQRTARQNRA